MRTLPLVLMAVVAVNFGTAFSQQFGRPSQLSPYGQSLQTRYQEPKAVDKAPKPLPATGGVIVDGGNGLGAGAPYSEGSVGMGDAGYAGDCGGAAGCGCGCGLTYHDPYLCYPWYVSSSALYMSRDCPDPVEVAADPAVNERELLGTQQVCPDDWRSGFEIRVGRRICNNLRLEGAYWTLDPDHSAAQVTDAAGQINASFDFSSLDTGFGPIEGWINNAEAMRISMRSEFHNVEMNVWGDNFVAPCSRLQLSWLSGARFFRFSEGFAFAAADGNTQLGANPAQEAHYNIDVDNNLIGWQLGFRAEYRPSCRLTLWAEPRFGIYYNHIEHRSFLGDGNGNAAVNAVTGQVWDIQSNKEDFATLGQLDLGASYDVNCRLSAYVGYRLVAASGVALSTNQITPFIADYNGIQAVDSNGHVFLHGVMAGMTFRFGTGGCCNSCGCGGSGCGCN